MVEQPILPSLPPLPCTDSSCSAEHFWPNLTLEPLFVCFLLAFFFFFPWLMDLISLVQSWRGRTDKWWDWVTYSSQEGDKSKSQLLPLQFFFITWQLQSVGNARFLSLGRIFFLLHLHLYFQPDIPIFTYMWAWERVPALWRSQNNVNLPLVTWIAVWDPITNIWTICSLFFSNLQILLNNFMPLPLHT